MTLTNIAMLGILIGFVFLVVGFLMEGPQAEAETTWNKKPIAKKAKKRAPRTSHLHKKVA